MRRLFMACALLTVLGATPGMAEDYPWCVVEPGHGLSPECSFTSLEQCRGSSAGAGNANCTKNPFYKEPAPVVQSSPPPSVPVANNKDRKKRQTNTNN